MVESLCCTLRSLVHEIFSHYRTVSPRLGDHYASKCSSDNFPHTKHILLCVENCQNYIAMHRWSPIARWRSWNWDKLCDSFPCFSNLLPVIGEQQNIKVWFSKFSTHEDVYFVCEKLSELHFDTHLRGDSSIIWENVMHRGSQSATYRYYLNFF